MVSSPPDSSPEELDPAVFCAAVGTDCPDRRLCGPLPPALRLRRVWPDRAHHLIDLAAKNAILVVEFARDEMAKGRDVIDAALEGAKLRLRPILMTALAFILGCLPPMIASGSGGRTSDPWHGGGDRQCWRPPRSPLS